MFLNAEVFLPGDLIRAAHSQKHEPETSAGRVATPAGFQRCEQGCLVVDYEDDLASDNKVVLSTAVRYVPNPGDLVVGIVTTTNADGYRVDINAPSEAILPSTAFNNATQANRPKLTVGASVLGQVVWAGHSNSASHLVKFKTTAEGDVVVDGRVVKADEPDSEKVAGKSSRKLLASKVKKLLKQKQALESLQSSDNSREFGTFGFWREAGHPVGSESAEISCLSRQFPQSWSSGEAYLGSLKEGGYTIEVPLAYAHCLQQKRPSVLRLLGQHLDFECVVGANGRIWLRSAEPKKTLIIANVIKRSQALPLEKIQNLVDRVAKLLADVS